MSYGLIGPTTCQDRIHSQEIKYLNRQEAKQRLSRLIPGSEEYNQLQDALTRIEGIVEISLPSFTYKVFTAPEEQKLIGGFGSFEHVAIGAEVILKKVKKDEPLIIVGTVPIKFKHIVALAGDFYAIAGQAISLPGGTDEEKTSRFQNAFNTLFKGNPEQIRDVIQEIEGECMAVRHAALPHHCYCSHMMEKNDAIKKIKPDINDLLVDNSDHFSVNAEEAYRIGHTLALDLAIKAKNDEDLKYAYAIDAFACHFLTDLFASGHIRNQRGPLETFLKTLGFGQVPIVKDIPGLRTIQNPKKLAGLLTAAQHEEDGKEGLNVSNDRGDTWRAYGDGCFFTPPNKQNKEKVEEATQRSVDEIHEAYIEKKHPEKNRVYDLIPHATDFNPLPLYKVKLKQQKLKLTLHSGSKAIKIKTKEDFLKKGVAHALQHLPKNYIDGFLGSPKANPILKVAHSQVSRFFGFVWQILGLPSYNHVKNEFQSLNEKIDEMAQILKAMYDINEKIFEQLKSIDNHLHELLLFQDIRGPINDIKCAAQQYIHFKSTLDEKQIELADTKLWEAWNKICSIFLSGTADKKNILFAYKQMITKVDTVEPFEAKIRVTHWFRQMIDYQIKAFNLYVVFKMMGNSFRNVEVQNKRKEDILKQTRGFESLITDQIKANREYIVESLIYISDEEIESQLEKYRRSQAIKKVDSRSDFDSLMEGTLEVASKVLSSRFEVRESTLRSPMKVHFLDNKAIQKWLKKLERQPEIAPLLELAKWSALGIYRETEQPELSICINSKKVCAEDNKIYIEASEGVKSYEFFGFIIRELTRFVAKEVFSNAGKPYYRIDEAREKIFKVIADNVEKDSQSLDMIIKKVFQTGSFPKDQWHQELLSRVPQMLVTYHDASQNEGRNGIQRLELNSSTKDLLDYYRGHFLDMVQAYTQFVVKKAKKPFPHIFPS